MASFTTGDTAPTLTGTCTSGTTPANITGAAVALHIRWADGTIATKTATIVDGAAGTWSYDWQTNDIIAGGLAWVEAQVTYSNGKIQTFGPVQFAVQTQYA